jgi:hypothetical protein
MRSSKWIKFLAFSVFFIFSGVDLSENYIHHHHDKTEDSDCAYCGFHKAVSNSDLSAAPVDLVPLFFVFFAIAVLVPSYRSSRFVLRSGRAPPVVLS